MLLAKLRFLPNLVILNIKALLIYYVINKRSDLVHWEDLEGSDGEGGGRGDWKGEYMYTHGCFISMYDKIHYNTKKKKSNLLLLK